MASASPSTSGLMRRPTAALANLRRRIGREWRAGPIHRLTIAGLKPQGLAIRPRDHRPPDPSRGAEIAGGVFDYGGETLELIPDSVIRIVVQRSKDVPNTFIVTSEATYPKGETSASASRTFTLKREDGYKILHGSP